MRINSFNEVVHDGRAYKGKWELTKNHEISFKQDGQKQEFKFKATILDVKPNSIVLSVTEKQTNQVIRTSIAELKGKWLLNSRNRLVFHLKKQRGRQKTFTFKGVWHVDKQHQLEYTYKETQLKTKKKIEKKLKFKGFWDISSNRRLTYVLEGDRQTKFRFQGTFGTKSILAKKGEIRYQIGFWVNQTRRTKTITLFGKWKYSNKLGLSFEIKYPKGKARSIVFEAKYRIDEKHNIAVKLKSKQGQRSLGVEVVFTRDIFKKQGEAFLKLVRNLDDTRLEAGVEFVF